MLRVSLALPPCLLDHSLEIDGVLMVLVCSWGFEEGCLACISGSSLSGIFLVLFNCWYVSLCGGFGVPLVGFDICVAFAFVSTPFLSKRWVFCSVSSCSVLLQSFESGKIGFLLSFFFLLKWSKFWFFFCSFGVCWFNLQSDIRVATGSSCGVGDCLFVLIFYSFLIFFPLHLTSLIWKYSAHFLLIEPDFFSFPLEIWDWKRFLSKLCFLMIDGGKIWFFLLFLCQFCCGVWSGGCLNYFGLPRF